jgi:hypothetical protein
MPKPKPSGPKRGSAQRSKNTSKDTFLAQAVMDYPFSTYETDGRKMNPKLTPYELYLVDKHFPPMEKKFNAYQNRANAARKRGRQEAIIKAGLAPSPPSPSGSDAADAPIFSRTATDVLL